MRVTKAVLLFGGLFVASSQAQDVLTDTVEAQQEDDATTTSVDDEDDEEPVDDGDDGDETVEGDQSEGRTRLKVFRNGRFTIFNRRVQDGTVDLNAVSMGLDYVWEKDADGRRVGVVRNGQDTPENNHGDGRFWKRSNLKFSVERNITVGDARAHKITYRSEIENVGNMTMEVFLLKSEGDVGPDLSDSEAARWPGFPGTVKFNIVFEDWKFCGDDVDCGGREGAFIDVVMRIRARSASFNRSEVVRGSGRGVTTYNLGGNMDLDFTNETLIDGQLQEMPEGFPMLAQRSVNWGGRSVSSLTFRFPKFEESAVYDPIVENLDAEDDDTTTTGAAGDDDDDGTTVQGGDDSGAVRTLSAISGLLTLLARA